MPDLSPLFGILIIDRDPLTLANLPGLFQAWLMDAGAFAFIGLMVYLLYVMLGRRGVELGGMGVVGLAAAASPAAVVGVALLPKKSSTPEREQRYPLSLLMVACFAAALICFAVYGFLLWTGWGVDAVEYNRVMRYDPTGYNKYVPPEVSFRSQPLVLSLAGLLSIVGVGAPFFGALGGLIVRAAGSGRAPTGTPSLGGTAALLAGLWVVIGVLTWVALGVVPAAREAIGVVSILSFIATAGWAAYRCRLADRLGPVYAVAKLTVLEVIRSRAFLALLLLLVPTLFPITWFIQPKAGDELRLNVGMATTLTQVLLLLMAGALASFAIPNDVKNQNLYTVVTKPVQPFDVVLGRFFGYTALATVALAIVTFGSWLFIQGSNISETARKETFKARVPLRGTLGYESRAGVVEGTDVGREFNYRKYIAGHPDSPQRAVWRFGRLPASLASASGQAVPVEFTFDIYRLTKGLENRGVDVNIRVATWRCPQVPPPGPRDGVWRWGQPDEERRYTEVAKDKLAAATGRPRDAISPKEVLSAAKPGSPEWAVANELAREFGFYEIVTKEVFDYHPTGVLVPAALFENARATTDADGKKLPPVTDPATGKELPVPPPNQVMVYVKCVSSSQMLGMAEGDLYLMEAEQSFGQNFFKAAVGLWCRLVILIGLAVVCSTYLAGVVTFLAAGFVFLLGYASEAITELVSGKGAGGGPLRAISQIAQAKLPTAPNEGTGAEQAAALADTAFAWLIRRVANLFPDVYAYDWTPYLSEGFNVSFENLAMNVLVMVGYLVPWMILGYYLIRGREVAA